MQKLSYNIQSKPYSTYVSISGSLTSSAANALREKLCQICHDGKDLYIDVKDLKEVDIYGLSALLAARIQTNNHDGETVVFINKTNPLFALLNSIKFDNQLNFRDCLIMDPYISIAS